MYVVHDDVVDAVIGPPDYIERVVNERRQTAYEARPPLPYSGHPRRSKPSATSLLRSAPLPRRGESVTGLADVQRMVRMLDKADDGLVNEHEKVDQAGEAKWCEAFRPVIEKYKDGLFEPTR